MQVARFSIGGGSGAMALCSDPVLQTSSGQYSLCFQIKAISDDACQSVGLALPPGIPHAS